MTEDLLHQTFFLTEEILSSTVIEKTPDKMRSVGLHDEFLSESDM